nr:uncharacterized protein LOC111512086 [Leptinotarsa decemlineata]
MYHLLYTDKYPIKMFRFFAIVFAAILAIAVAAPKPSIVASPLVASTPIAYSAPLTYASGYVASPLAYRAPLAYSTYGSYAYPHAAPLLL